MRVPIYKSHPEASARLGSDSHSDGGDEGVGRADGHSRRNSQGRST